MTYVSSFANGTPGGNSAEIVVHDPQSQRLFVANSLAAKLDIIDFSDPSSMSLISSNSISAYGNINSVAVKNGIVACAIENIIPELDGFVVFFDTNGVFINQVTVGPMPDMITFNHSGTRVLTANEGQPKDDYTVDPIGSVGIVDISGGIPGLTQSNVTIADFTSYNSQLATLKASGIRIYGPGATVAQDMEPEYITVSDDDLTAWVVLQENNAMGKLDLVSNTFTEIRPLGYKDHSINGNGLDATNTGTNVNIASWPVKGMYLQDAVANFTVGGDTYLITANEGDARAYSGLNEETTIGSSGYVLDPAAFPFASAMKSNASLGRLKTTNMLGDTDADGDMDEIYTYGGRSFSIWNAASGALIYDSGDDLEEITANDPLFGSIFNSSNTNVTKKDRSDDKGPEPEGVAVASIAGNQYAFISMERVGGLMMYNINDPAAPVFVQYVNNRSLSSIAGDRGPEGIIFIEQQYSPNGKGLIVLGNEVSSTVSVYEIACPNTTLAVTGPTSFCTGDSASLSAPVIAGAMYTWYEGTTPVAGATAATFHPAGSGNYSVEINNTGCTINSNAVSITAEPLPDLTVTASGPTTFCAGNTVTFSAAAGNTYQWLMNGTATTATSDEYTVGATGSYAVIVTGANACSDTSSSQTVVVNALPDNSTTFSGSLSFCQGDSVILTAAPGLSYQWMLNGSALTGATGASYTAVADGSYQVLVSNTACTDTSSAISVTVYTLPVAPVITQSGVLLTSTPATTYQWYMDGTALTGETSQSYTVSSNGVYHVMITDGMGCGSPSAPLSFTTTGLEQSLLQASMNVYPNPAVHMATIEILLPEEKDITILITDLAGKSVAEVQQGRAAAGISRFYVDASPLEAGIYFLELHSEGLKKISRLTIIR